MIRSYDRLAARYDKMHGRWLRQAGGEAQAALEACLKSRVSSAERVLDAGCGTGHLARTVTSCFDGLSVTMLDVSQQMLDQAQDVQGHRVCGSLLDMPFEDGQFDLAVAAWSIEATEDEVGALRELMRVVRPGGRVIVAFCATEPSKWLGARVLRKGIELRRTGRFLDAQSVMTAFFQNGADEVLRHRCDGPVAVLDARVAQYQEMARAA